MRTVRALKVALGDEDHDHRRPIHVLLELIDALEVVDVEEDGDPGQQQAELPLDGGALVLPWFGLGLGLGLRLRLGLGLGLELGLGLGLRLSVRVLAGSSPVPQIWLRKRCHVWPLTRGRSGDALVDCEDGEGRGIAKGAEYGKGAQPGKECAAQPSQPSQPSRVTRRACRRIVGTCAAMMSCCVAMAAVRNSAAVIDLGLG